MWNYNFYVYITTNRDKSILYIGVTNDLHRRLNEHYANRGNPSSFAGKYHCYYLIYYERYSDVNHAIEREKELKKWRKEKKITPIRAFNPDFIFLNSTVNPDGE